MENVDSLNIGDIVSWYETMDGRRTGFKMSYEITRINKKRNLVWGKTILRPLWPINSIQLNISQLEK